MKRINKGGNMMEIKTLIRDEIKSEIEELGKMMPGEDNYKCAVDGICKLGGMLNEMEKIDMEANQKAVDREIEMELKMQQMQIDKKDKFIKNCITVGSTLTGILVTAGGTYVALKFEKDGDIITTIPGKKFLTKLLDFK